MDKEIKAFIDEEYINIYRELNIAWKIGITKEKNKLREKGLSNSGFEQKQLCDYAINLVRNNDIKIKEFIENSQKKFDFIMTNEEIEKYFENSNKNNLKYLEMFEKELEEYFGENKMPLVENCKSRFKNAKASNKAELEKIKKELILINRSKKSKSKEKKRFSKGDIIGIISIIVAIILFILGLIFA